MQGGSPASVKPRHVVFFNWRDTANPEGGGSERYVEQMARGLVAHGARATIFCAAHDQAPADEVVDGVQFVRRGSKFGVYFQGLRLLLSRKFGRIDAVVDVQNGLPFFTRLATRKPVIVLVHHVHREQWQVVYPGFPGRVGWWIESKLAPHLYKGSQYIAVSRATRDELISLGVDRRRIAVVHNGTDPAPAVDAMRSSSPTVCVVGRLVPHKQVEHAIAAVAALRHIHPDIHLRIVGSGWWDEELRKYAANSGATDIVSFEGHLSEQEKHRVYAESWIMALPSLKEGWGLVVGEAGMHGVPTVAYSAAGGTRESIAHNKSGVLVTDQAEFTETLQMLLLEQGTCRQLGEGARTMAHQFTWPHSQGSFSQVVDSVLLGDRVSVEDPDED